MVAGHVSVTVSLGVCVGTAVLAACVVGLGVGVPSLVLPPNGAHAEIRSSSKITKGANHLFFCIIPCVLLRLFERATTSKPLQISLCSIFPYFKAAIKSGSSFWALGAPQPVTGSQPGTASNPVTLTWPCEKLLLPAVISRKSCCIPGEVATL